MNVSLLEIFVGLLSTGSGAFFGWLFGRKQYNANVKSLELDNFSKALDTYKKMYEDMMGDLKTRQNELIQENQALKDELGETRKQVMTLTNFVLASAIQRADGSLKAEDLDNLKKIITT